MDPDSQHNTELSRLQERSGDESQVVGNTPIIHQQRDARPNRPSIRATSAPGSTLRFEEQASQHASIPEYFVGNRNWSGVDYNRMPSRCRMLYGMPVFRKHDEKRFDQFIEDATNAAEAPPQPGVKVQSVKTGANLPRSHTTRVGGMDGVQGR